MFDSCTNLRTIYVSEYNEGTGKGWTTAEATNSSSMFYYCSNLIGQNGTKYNSSYTNATYARIDKDGAPGYLTNITSTNSLEASEETNINTAEVYTVKENDGTEIKEKQEDPETADVKNEETISEEDNKKTEGQVIKNNDGTEKIEEEEPEPVTDVNVSANTTETEVAETINTVTETVTSTTNLAEISTQTIN